jgi:uracil-DNA glycosylase family 4
MPLKSDQNNKQPQLDELRIREQAAELPLKETATNLVFGDGNPDADVMFIGEAPGKNEDLQGLPFVGSAGKILDKLIESAGLTRDQVYITSVLRYRPPKNRDPKPSEIEAVAPFLDEQIKIINPKIIATLGRHSLKKFLPDAKIAQVHGTPQKISWQGMDLIIFPLYHPAAVIYNRGLNKTLQEDFLKLRDII